MSGSWPVDDLPRLSLEPHDITSKKTRKYNCIAWAAGCKNRWWWPDPQGIGYWPSGVQREINLEAFVAVFEKQGYELCPDGELERGFEKVALFANHLEDGSFAPTHTAIQLDNGHWSSKLGECEDIEHYALESVNGPRYGVPVRYLRRKRLGEKQLNRMLGSKA